MILLLFLLLLSACSVKKVPVKIPQEKKSIKLTTILSSLSQNCQTKNFKDEYSSIYVKNEKNFLAINLNDKNEFRNKSYNLTQDAKEKLRCIIPILKENSELFIVVTGHADENKKEQKNQHLSDNRAISVAEFLFNEGLRDEIFTKGCASNLLKEQKEKLNIFIHEDKSQIKNHCLNH